MNELQNSIFTEFNDDKDIRNELLRAPSFANSVSKQDIYIQRL